MRTITVTLVSACGSWLVAFYCCAMGVAIWQSILPDFGAANFVPRACLKLILSHLMLLTTLLHSLPGNPDWLFSLGLWLPTVSCPVLAVAHLLQNKKLQLKQKRNWLLAIAGSLPLQLTGIPIYLYWLLNYCPGDRLLRISAAVALPLVVVPLLLQRHIGMLYLALLPVLFVIVRWVWLTVKAPLQTEAQIIVQSQLEPKKLCAEPVSQLSITLPSANDLAPSTTLNLESLAKLPLPQRKIVRDC